MEREQILRIFNDNAAAIADHDGPPTVEDYQAAIRPTADMCGVCTTRVREVVADAAIMGAN